MCGIREGELAYFVNARGEKIQTKTWHPDGDPVAIVVFLHGYTMSSTDNRAWQRVADAHTARGFLCGGLDYPGHGGSEGRRHHVEDIALIADDVLQFLEAELLPRRPGLPVFLRGQSLGGLVALAAALRRPQLFRGLALGAPPYELRVVPDLWLRLRRHAIFLGSSFLHERIGELSVPLAVFQGVEDWTVSPTGARRLVQAAASVDRALYLYKDMGHNMSMEPDILNWLSQRLAADSCKPASGASAAAVLCLRRPLPGAPWPPPPGSEDAAAGTEIQEFRQAEEQARTLDELLGRWGAGPL